MKSLLKLSILGILWSSCNSKQTVSIKNQNEIWVAYEDTLQKFDNRYGYKDLAGHIKIPPQYIMVETDTFDGSIAFVREQKPNEESRLLVINRKNQPLFTPFMYDNGHDEYHERLFRFVEKGEIGKGGKIGFADSTGKVVIPAQFTFANWFQEGLASFCNDCTKQYFGEHWEMKGKWGFINKQGVVVIPPQYDVVEGYGFENGKAWVSKDGKKFHINQKGEKVP